MELLLSQEVQVWLVLVLVMKDPSVEAKNCSHKGNSTYDITFEEACVIFPTTGLYQNKETSDIYSPKLMSLRIVQNVTSANDASNPIAVIQAFRSTVNVTMDTTCEGFPVAKSLTSHWPEQSQSVSHGVQGTHCLELNGVEVGKALVDLATHQKIKKVTIFYSDFYKEFLDQLMSTVINGSIDYTLFSLTDQPAASTDWTDQIQHVTTVLLLVNQTRGETMFIQARKLGLLKPAYKWIILTDDVTHSKWTQMLEPWERVMLLLVQWPLCNCQFYNVETLDEYDRISLWRMDFGSEQTECVGHWRPNEGFHMNYINLWEFKKFQNKAFNIVTIHLPIFHYKVINSDASVTWKGICVEILEQLSKSMNFSYNLLEPPDQKWGMQEDDGTWNGMVGMVYRGEVDFALGKFTISTQRDTVIDFADPFWHEPTMMVYRRPDEQSIKVFIGPFKWQVWLLFIISVPFMGVITSTIVVLSPVYEQLLKINNVRQKASHIFKEITWYIYGAALQQGGVWYPHTQASKFLIGFWWFFTLALSATYTGNLIAFLTVPRTELPIQTVSDLADQNYYDYGVVDGSALNTLLKVSSQHTYQELYKKRVQFKKNLVRNHAHGLKRAKEENYVYIGEMSGVATKVYSDCNYTVAKEKFFPSSFAFVFPEGSPLIPLVSDRISKMLESGLVQRWKRIYYPPNLCNRIKSIEMPKAASLKTTQGAFYILFLGIAVACIVLWTECVVRCMRTNRIPSGATFKGKDNGLTTALGHHVKAMNGLSSGVANLGKEFQEFKSASFSELTFESRDSSVYQNGNAILH